MQSMQTIQHYAQLLPELTLWPGKRCGCFPSHRNTHAFKMKKTTSFSTPALHLSLNNFERWAVIKATKGNSRGEDELPEFEHDPDAASILMGQFDDPEKLRKRIEERIKKKKKDILQTKTGSAEPMIVTFKDFDFSDSCYIWIEFSHSPSNDELDLISGTIRSWYLLGHTGGYNSLNMQLHRDQESGSWWKVLGKVERRLKLCRRWIQSLQDLKCHLDGKGYNEPHSNIFSCCHFVFYQKITIACHALMLHKNELLAQIARGIESVHDICNRRMVACKR